MTDPAYVGQDGRLHVRVTDCNTDYLFYRPHRDRDMVPIDAERFSTNQDASVRLIGWAGNMTISNRALQGVIVA